MAQPTIDPAALAHAIQAPASALPPEAQQALAAATAPPASAPQAGRTAPSAPPAIDPNAAVAKFLQSAQPSPGGPAPAPGGDNRDLSFLNDNGSGAPTAAPDPTADLQPVPAGAPPAGVPSPADPTADLQDPTADLQPEPGAAPPASPDQPPPIADASGPSAAIPSTGSPIADTAIRNTLAFGGGALEGVFHTYDFFTGGEPLPQDKTPFRQKAEGLYTGLTRQEGWFGNLANGLAQFMPGLIATEGVGTALSAVPKVGAAVTAATEGAPRIVGSIKGAIAGALSLDPHGGNIANLVNTYVPSLSNPVSDALAANPGDTEAMGRLKNAVGSLGFDAAVAGILKGSVGVYHYLKTGNPEAAQASAQEVMDAHAAMGPQPQAPAPAAPAANAEAPTPTTQAGQAPAAPTVIDRPSVLRAMGDTENGVDMAAVGSHVSSQVQSALDAGQQVTLYADGGKKVVPITAVNRGMMQDAQGQRWGTMDLMTTPGSRVEIGGGSTTEAAPAPPPGTAPDDWEKQWAKGSDNLPHIEGETPAPAEAPAPAAPAAPAATPGPQRSVSSRALATMGPRERAYYDQVQKEQDAAELGDSARTFLDGGPQAGEEQALADQKGNLGSTDLNSPRPDEEGAPPLTVHAREAEAAPAVAPPETGEPAEGGAPTITADSVTNEPSLTAAQPPQRGLGLLDFSASDLQGAFEKAQEDADVLADHDGDFDTAIQFHDFGDGAGIPWQKINGDPAFNALLTRASEAVRPQWDDLKGGDVQTDPRVLALTQKMVSIYNMDPGSAIAQLMQTGASASRLAADMNAAFSIGTKMLVDVKALAARMEEGDLTAYGGDLQAAQADLSRRMVAGLSLIGSGQSIKSNTARALRQMQFAIDPSLLAAQRFVDPEQMAELANTVDLPALRKMATPGMWGRLKDRLGLYIVANLLSRPETALRVLFSNTAMMLQRPAERIIGSFGVGNKGASIREQAFRQYYFMGASLMDGFKAGVRAFKSGDSMISPHPSDIARATQEDVPRMPLAYSGGDGVPSLINNTLTSAIGPLAWKAITIGPRVHGAVNEMVQTITYRSMVAAKAYMDGAAEARANGLEGADAKAYVGNVLQQRMDAAFDEDGYATDLDAQREAQTATFSQQLQEGTIGAGIENLVAQHPGLRVILPFIKIPTNILRYAVKLTPGLNVVQTEYRQALMGQLGEQAKAQAMGQMGLGTLFLGSAAFMASEGLITGGGPKDPQASKALQATGWRPYSFVKRDADGNTTYLPYGPYDPIALPFGVVADIVHGVRYPGDDGSVANVSTALLMGVAKAVANKSYLTSLSNLMDTATSDNPRKWQHFLGTEAEDFVPLSAGQRWVTNSVTDGLLRDARSMADTMMANTPGASNSLPAVYDAFGDPVHINPMLYSQHYDDPVDQEVQRMNLEQGPDAKSLTPASPDIGSGVDLRQVGGDGRLSDGRDAYETYQQLAGHPDGAPALRDIIGGIMTNPAYAAAPDGPPTVQGTKMHMLEGPIRDYRAAARRQVAADPVVASALQQQRMKVASAYATQQAAGGAAANKAKGSANALNALLQSTTGINPGVQR